MISSLSLISPAFTRQGSQLRDALQRTSTELTTMAVHDPGKHLRGDFSAAVSIGQSLARLDGFGATTATQALLAQTMQSVLSTISQSADTLSQKLITTLGPASATLKNLSLATGSNYFQAAISALGQDLMLVKTNKAPREGWR